MYHPQLPMRALVKRRPIWQIIDGWNSFPFICIPLLLYQSLIFVAMRQTSLSWIATTRWEQCQPMPTIYYCYFAVVDVRWFSGASHLQIPLELTVVDNGARDPAPGMGKRGGRHCDLHRHRVFAGGHCLPRQVRLCDCWTQWQWQARNSQTGFPPRSN